MKRLREQLPPGFETALLDAATLDRPSTAAKERALKAATAAAGAMAASSAGNSAVATGTSSSWKTLPWMKWMAALLVTASGFGAWTFRDGDEQTPVPAPLPAPVVAVKELAPLNPPLEVKVPEPLPVTEAPRVKKEKAIVQRSPAPVAAAIVEQPLDAETSLMLQVKQLAKARSALTSNHLRDALTEARVYHQKWPAGSFLTEAQWIEIEALIRLNQIDAASELVRRFEATHPEHFHRAQVDEWNRRMDVLSSPPSP